MRQNQDDPENWVGGNCAALDLAENFVEIIDAEFGEPSMYYKFLSYYPDRDHIRDRTECEPFLNELEKRLSKQTFSYGNHISVADVTIFPSVDGFAKIEPDWFAGRFPNLNDWLGRMSASPHIQSMSFDHTPWKFA